MMQLRDLKNMILLAILPIYEYIFAYDFFGSSCLYRNEIELYWRLSLQKLYFIKVSFTYLKNLM